MAGDIEQGVTTIPDQVVRGFHLYFKNVDHHHHQHKSFNLYVNTLAQKTDV